MQEIVSHNCRDLVDAVPFFKNGSAIFVRKVLTLLRFEVFLPGDYIIREGTFGTEMYFIRQGSVDILVNGECITTLNEGNYFGGEFVFGKLRNFYQFQIHHVYIN